MQKSVIPADFSWAMGLRACPEQGPAGNPYRRRRSVYRSMGRLVGWIMLIITVFLLPGTWIPLSANYLVDELYPCKSAGNPSGPSEKERQREKPPNPMAEPEGETGIFGLSAKRVREENKPVCHLVEKGETLWRIAMRYGTSVETLQSLNRIPDPMLIRYGRLIRVPAGKVCGEKESSLKGLSSHLVENGETLWRIARRYGTSVETLQLLNRIDDPTMVRYGRVIRVPAGKMRGETGIFLIPRKRGKEEKKLSYHLVERGETLWRIARRYETSVETLQRINRIADPTRVRYGSLIGIPSARGSVETDQRRFRGMSFPKQIAFLKRWTIKEGHPYLAAIVETAHRFNIDSRLYASLIWEESWFDRHASSTAGCRGLAQLNPRVHPVSEDVRENFRRSAGYLMKLYLYFIEEGFDKRSAVISALAAYNRGDTKVRNDIRMGRWDGKTIDNIPYFETKKYIVRVLERCRMNYQAVL